MTTRKSPSTPPEKPPAVKAETPPKDASPPALPAPSVVPAPAPSPIPAPPPPPPPSGEGPFLGTGRRKTSVARVRLKVGSGSLLVNGRPLGTHFPAEQDRIIVLQALKHTGMGDRVDVWANVVGGGLSGQSGAISLGIARALFRYSEAFEPILRGAGLLTRDSRRKERKHYGHKGARRSFQWTKR